MQDREQAAEPAEQPGGGAADDAAALEALAAGDLAHFDALVGRHRGRLFGFLWNQTGDAQRAEDLLQETFLRAVNAARSGLGPRNPDATAWLFTIARRLVIDERRRRSARPLRIVDDSRALDPRRQRAADDALVAAEEHERAAAALAALPEAQREAVSLRVHGGLSFRQMGEAVGEPEGTVKSRVYAGLAALRDALGDDDRHEVTR